MLPTGDCRAGGEDHGGGGEGEGDWGELQEEEIEEQEGCAGCSQQVLTERGIEEDNIEGAGWARPERFPGARMRSMSDGSTSDGTPGVS